MKICKCGRLTHTQEYSIFARHFSQQTHRPKLQICTIRGKSFRFSFYSAFVGSISATLSQFFLCNRSYVSPIIPNINNLLEKYQHTRQDTQRSSKTKNKQALTHTNTTAKQMTAVACRSMPQIRSDLNASINSPTELQVYRFQFKFTFLFFNL